MKFKQRFTPKVGKEYDVVLDGGETHLRIVVANKDWVDGDTHEDPFWECKCLKSGQTYTVQSSEFVEAKKWLDKKPKAK